MKNKYFIIRLGLGLVLIVASIFISCFIKLSGEKVLDLLTIAVILDIALELISLSVGGFSPKKFERNEISLRTLFEKMFLVVYILSGMILTTEFLSLIGEIETWKCIGSIICILGHPGFAIFQHIKGD